MGAPTTGFLKTADGDGLWSGAPDLNHPEVAYGISDDFVELGVGDATSRWTLDATNGTAVLGSAETVGLGGVVVLNAPGGLDNDWVSLKLTTTDTGAAFKITKDSGKKLWFGAKLSVEQIIETCCYVGLFAEGEAEVGADDTGARNMVDGVYFRMLLHAVSDAWDFATTKNSVEQEVAAAAQAADTDSHIFGLYFNGESTIYAYIDGSVVGQQEVDDAEFPDDVGLTPLVFVKTGEAGSKDVHLDWIKCVQLR